jgi:hypothetical protein
MARGLPYTSVPLLALGARAVSAGDIDIQLGTEVRVTTSGPIVTGILAGLTPKEIVLRRNDEQVEFPLADVMRLERMNPGRTANVPAWTVGFAAVGGGMGAAVAFVTSKACTTGPASLSNCVDNTHWTPAVLVGAALGAGGGYCVARYAIRRGPHWEDVQLRPRISVGAMPVRGRGFGLTVAVAF